MMITMVQVILWCLPLPLLALSLTSWPWVTPSKTTKILKINSPQTMTRDEIQVRTSSSSDVGAWVWRQLRLFWQLQGLWSLKSVDWEGHKDSTSPDSFVAATAFTKNSSSACTNNLSTIPLLNGNISKIHIIVLVHGWLGSPKEMDYLKHSLARQALRIGTDIQRNHVERNPTGRSSTIDTSSSISTTQDNQVDLSAMNPTHVTVDSPLEIDAQTVEDIDVQDNKQKQLPLQDLFVIYSADCNRGPILTSDGIAAGGLRLASEIDHLISKYIRSSTKETPQQITLSLVGNSLGGLYCRYAVSALQAIRSKTVCPKLFVTTCTPHLGVSQHTFVKLPTWIESPIAKIMQKTGIDLFRRSNIIQEMTTNRRFVQPLQEFQQRIAYANVFGTDFQVPTATAAFWADTDSIHQLKHHFADRKGNEKDNYGKVTHNIVLQVTTPKQVQEHDDAPTTNADTDIGTNADNYSDTDTEVKWTNDNQSLSSAELSTLLDQMGWTKVLVDVRHHLPLASWRAASSFSTSGTTATRTTTVTHEVFGSAASKSCWTARELQQEFDTHYFRTVPLGHTVLVANSKDAINKYLNQGGKGTMDYLASSIINQLLHGNEQSPVCPFNCGNDKLQQGKDEADNKMSTDTSFMRYPII